MTDNERELIIGWLVAGMGWNRSVFDKMSNRELLNEYERYNRLNRGE